MSLAIVRHLDQCLDDVGDILGAGDYWRGGDEHLDKAESCSGHFPAGAAEQDEDVVEDLGREILGELVPEGEVDPGDGEDGAVDHVGRARQPRQHRAHEAAHGGVRVLVRAPPLQRLAAHDQQREGGGPRAAVHGADGEHGLGHHGEDKVRVRLLEAGDEVQKAAQPRGLRGRGGGAERGQELDLER